MRNGDICTIDGLILQQFGCGRNRLEREGRREHREEVWPNLLLGHPIPGRVRYITERRNALVVDLRQKYLEALKTLRQSAITRREGTEVHTIRTVSISS